MRISNVTKKTIIAEEAVVADSFLSRSVGLLHRRDLGEGEALIITRCRSIHMFFMKFSIDAIFVDKKDRVVGIVEKIKPFRLSPVFWKASYVIELPAGSIAKSKTSSGDFVKVHVERA